MSYSPGAAIGIGASFPDLDPADLRSLPCSPGTKRASPYRLDSFHPFPAFTRAEGPPLETFPSIAFSNRSFGATPSRSKQILWRIFTRRTEGSTEYFPLGKTTPPPLSLDILPGDGFTFRRIHRPVSV